MLAVVQPKAGASSNKYLQSLFMALSSFPGFNSSEVERVWVNLTAVEVVTIHSCYSKSSVKLTCVGNYDCQRFKRAVGSTAKRAATGHISQPVYLVMSSVSWDGSGG